MSQPLQPKGYVARIVDAQLDELLNRFGAVEVVGTMWCGKTWTSLSRSQSVTRIGLTGQRIAAEADPQTALLGEAPHLIDEWQDVPSIWDEVRAKIDENAGRAGQFILTGSSEPQKSKVHHSGAGRIAHLRMSTMTLWERGLSSGTVSLKDLFSRKFTPQPADMNLVQLAEALCIGGWPSLLHETAYAPAYLDSYLEALFSVSVPRKNLSGLESRRVCEALARNIGTSAKLSTIADDCQFIEQGTYRAEEKVSAHIGALESLYVLEKLKGWDAPLRSKNRLRRKPKRYFADPSLAVNLLGTNPSRLLADGQLLGILFESLVVHDLLVYARALPDALAEPLFYYRDADGLEVDGILELRDGSWAAIEVKLGMSKVEDGIQNLCRLRKKIASNSAARNPEPAFCAVIVGVGTAAYYDSEHDVYVIPFSTLKP